MILSHLPPPPPPENWDILRNHRYTVGITSIDGRGYDKEDEALHSKAINIETEIEIWDENDFPITDTDGQYYLKVNTDSLYFYKEGRERLLSIHTDHPDGWSLEIDSPGMDWVTASLMSANTGNKDKTFIECSNYTPGNSVEDHREGYITIKAGRIRRNIKIYQVAEPELTIEVSPNELVFRKSGSSPKSVTVKVYPETSKVYFSEATIPNTNPISWVSGSGFPISGSTWVSPGVYSFQPQANPSSTDLLSSLINVYIMDDDGRIVGQTVTISQWATDLLFDYTPKTPFPADEGSATVKVESDTDWWAYAKDDTGNVIATWANTRYDAGTTNYTATLNPNPGWTERSGKLLVMSTDDDFAGKHIEFKQAGQVPTIAANLTSINFGSGSGPAAQSITLTTNAQWDYSAIGTMTNVLVANGVSPASNSSESPAAAQSQKITFTPQPYSAASGTPAYTGTALSTTLRFATKNHAPHAQKNVDVVLTRTVPSHWKAGGLVSNGATGRTGGTITVKASSNATWGIQATVTNGTGTKTGSVTAQTYAERQASVTIPANNTWSNNTINVTYTGAGSGSVGSYSQAGYTLTGASVTGTSTPTAATGGSATIQINGDYPNVTIASRVNGQTTNLATNIITAGTGAKSASVTIPASTLWTTRVIAVGYIHPNGGGWNQLATYTQAARYSIAYSTTNMPSPIPGEGGTYTISFSGTNNGSTFRVRAMNGNTQVAINTASASYTQSITIPFADAQRTLTFQYEHPSTKTWTAITGLSRTQSIGPYLINNSFYLERGPDRYTIGQWVNNTGTCPSGWRLPNQNERNALNGRSDLGFVNNRFYFSGFWGTVASGTVNYGYGYPERGTDKGTSNSTNYYRCVKSK